MRNFAARHWSGSSALTKPMPHRAPSPFSWTVLLSLLFLANISRSQNVALSSGAKFTDTTKAAGISFVHFKGNQGTAINLEEFGPGVCVADFDGDGWQDIYFVNGRDRYSRGISIHNALYRNNKDGTFTDVTDTAGVAGTGLRSRLRLGRLRQ
jgi:enediyne biosynthesis protein E4